MFIGSLCLRVYFYVGQYQLTFVNDTKSCLQLFLMRSLISVRSFRPRLNLIFQANRLKLPCANCLKHSLNSRRFDQLVAFVYQPARGTAVKIFPLANELPE